MDQASVCYEKGLTYRDMGLWKEAVAEFEMALGDDELKHRAGRQIAACLVEMEQFEQAERVLLQLLLSLEISREDRLDTISDLADVYLKTDRIEAGLERLVQIYHEDSNYFPDLRERIDELRETLGLPALDQAGTEHNLAISIMAAASEGSVAYTTTMEARFSHYYVDLNKQPKVKISNPVEYSFDQSTWSTGYYTYLSVAGMFVITYAPIPVGSLVFLRFNLPDDRIEELLCVIGQVVRQENRQDQSDGVLGMEVRFIKIENELDSVLQSFIHQRYSEEEEALQEPEKIRFLCDYCGRIVSVERVGCGKHVKCLCSESVFVPYPEHTPTKRNPLRGMHLASCRIDEVVGKGGAASVYKGHHLALDIPVAIKVLHPWLREFGTEVVKRFLREARVVARITNPNIIRVMNAGEEQGHNFIIMQYIRGGSLADFLGEGSSFSVSDVVRIFVDVCNALTAAHQQTVVHGDVKPANILLTHGGRAMLGDFGLVRVLRKSEDIVRKNAVRGTPMYMSPEQAMGEVDIDFRSDVYSVGATMYHLISGRPPFQAVTFREVIIKHIKEIPAPLTMVTPGVPRFLSNIVMKCLQKRPENRFQTTEEMKRALLAMATRMGLPELKPLSAHLLRKPRPSSNRPTSVDRRRTTRTTS